MVQFLVRRLAGPAEWLAEPAAVRASIDRQRAMALRTGIEFSMILFRARRHRRAAISARRLASVLRDRARSTDEIGWFDDSHLCLLLPATGRAGALRVAADIRALLSGKLRQPLYTVCTYPTDSIPEDTPARSLRQGALRRRRTAVPATARTLVHQAHGPTLVPRDRQDDDERDHDDDQHLDAGGNGHAASTGAARDTGEDFIAARVTHPAGVRFQATQLVPELLGGIAGAADLGSVCPPTVEMLLTRPLPAWKRVVDICCAGAGLIATAPLMALIAAAIRLTSPGPAIFCQWRAGIGGRPFRIFKFRTMVVNADVSKAALRPSSEQDGPAFKLRHDPRVTRLGRVLRTTSLDELPQLWNVFRGDMSLVGPRPLPMDESNTSDPWHRLRLDVTPGITCIWQVAGRSRVTFAEWMRMDLRYIRRRSLWADLKILCATVPAVLLRRGAY